MKRAALFSIATTFAFLAACVQAEEPSKEPPPLSQEILATVPKMECEQPKIPDRFSMPRDDIEYFFKRVNTYVDCVSKYVNERQAGTQKYSDLARAQAEAGNAAVNEVNDYRTKVKAFQDKHPQK